MIALLALSAAASLSSSPPPTDTPCLIAKGCHQLSAAEMFKLAERFSAQNDFAHAEPLLRALSDDPNPDYRAEARYRLGQLAEARRDLPAAEHWYRALLDEKPNAAAVRLALGRVLAARDKMQAAAREFRRAQAAGLPPDVAKAIDRVVSVLRSHKPFGGNLEIGLAPDSNINHATTAAEISVFGLPFTLSDAAKAQSGVGLSTVAQGYVRLALSKRTDLTTQLSMSGNFYRQSVFNDVSLILTTGPEIHFRNAQFRPSVLFGRRWFGGARFNDQYGGSIEARHTLGRTSLFALTGSAIHSTFAQVPEQNADTFSLQATLEKAMSPRLYARFYISGARNNAVAAAYANWNFGAGLSLSRQIGRMTGYAGVSYNRLNSDGPFYAFGLTRRENVFSVNAGLALRQITIAGLSPIIRLSHDENRSSLTLYDFRRNRVEVGLTRDF
jgi:hypothetical protein